MSLRPVHIAGLGQLPNLLKDPDHDETELVQASVSLALADAGLGKDDIGFYCSGSSDYVQGKPFSFATAIDGIGAWPPKRESHVEMDGAWALYEAYVRLQHGDVDTALVYAYGKGSIGDIDTVMSMQMDPYYVAPLGIGPLQMAALQAAALVHAGLATEQDFADVVARNLAAGASHGHSPVTAAPDQAALLASPVVSAPLRAHDQSICTDGGCAIVLRVGGGGPRIDGFAHIIEPQDLGLRDLTDSTSTRIAADRAGATRLDVAELSTPFSSQEIVLRRALGLDGTVVNPSGGSFAADTPFVCGLTRIAEATKAVRAGAHRALAHATTGPCLQHNLLCVLEDA